MSGAILPADPGAAITTYCVAWPSGQDWLELLFGMLTRLANDAVWYDATPEQAELATQSVLDAFAATLESYQNGACPMVGEIRLWPGANIPAGWLRCNGDAITLSNPDYHPLRDVLNYAYGGSVELGYFVLPNFVNRVALGAAAGGEEVGPALASAGGAATHTLTEAEIPAHTHARSGETFITRIGTGNTIISPSNGGGSQLTNVANVGSTGGGLAHNNLPPYLALHYIIYAGVV